METSMYQIDFKKPIAIHFIGIGGISMSGLAEILMREGFRVSGSDAHESELTEHLAAAGAKVMYGQAAANITDDMDLVVYTAAVHADNPEYAEVVRRGIPMMTRAELLGQIMKNYDYLHGDRDSSGSGERSDHLCRRNPAFHRWKHPRGRTGAVCDGGL